MIKLLLNPSLQLMQDEDKVLLISEVDCHSFQSEYLPLLKQLQQPTDIDDIRLEHLPYLRPLAELRLLVNANLNELPQDVASYWLAKRYHPVFTKAQLEMGIRFAGPHAVKYRELFSASYPECPVVDAGERLLAYFTSDLLQCDLAAGIRVPIVLIKVGGIKQSIGPVLSPSFTYADLIECINRPFNADLSIPVPDSVQATADRILLSELYHLRVQAGLHMATNHVVEWNMGRLTKKCWKVKLL